MASVEKSATFTGNDLNKRVTILIPVISRADDGTRVKTYKNGSTRWCNISIINFSNSDESGKTIKRKVSYRLVMRYSKGLVELETGFKYDGKTLLQSAPPIILSNGMLLCDCYEFEPIHDE